MKLITRDTDYALRAICCIAKSKNRFSTVTNLVKESKIPRPFLRKILQRLNKKGILKSYKGSGGGFGLAKGLDRIFLMDLMKVFQGEFRLNECSLKKKVCPNIKVCPLKKKIDRIEEHIISELGPVTISQILKQEA